MGPAPVTHASPHRRCVAGLHAYWPIDIVARDCLCETPARGETLVPELEEWCLRTWDFASEPRVGARRSPDGATR